jgi:hypothetical protein
MPFSQSHTQSVTAIGVLFAVLVQSPHPLADDGRSGDQLPVSSTPTTANAPAFATTNRIVVGFLSLPLLKCEGLEFQPGNAPGTYTIAHRDLSLDQVEDTTSDVKIGQEPRFGCGKLREYPRRLV